MADPPSQPQPRRNQMTSPTLPQKLTAEVIGTAILVFIGAGSVPLTVHLTGNNPFGSAQLSTISFGGHDRPGGDPQGGLGDRQLLHPRPAAGRDRGCAPDLRDPDRQRPGGPGPGLRGRRFQGRPVDRRRGRGDRHRDPCLHGLRGGRRRSCPGRLRRDRHRVHRLRDHHPGWPRHRRRAQSRQADRPRARRGRHRLRQVLGSPG